jgi:protoheme IX farnesyltransferase
MIGWAAATGDVSLASLALFAIIFMWTPPHFWSLALYRSDDYARAGIPMLPVVAGKPETRRHIMIYAVLLVPLTVAPYMLGVSGPLYLGAALVLGALFLATSARVWRDHSDRAARRNFHISILYLFLLFVALIADRAVVSLV